MAELFSQGIEVDGVLLIVFEESPESFCVSVEVLFPELNCDVFSFTVVFKSVDVECLFEGLEAAVHIESFGDSIEVKNMDFFG